MTRKTRIRMLKLESCGGCLSRIIMQKKLSDILNYIELTAQEKQGEQIDILLIEGAIANNTQENLVKEAVKNARKVILFGSCASYPHQILGIKSLKSPSKIQKPDYAFHGCPPSDMEIERFFTDIMLQKSFLEQKLPVCDECNKHEIMCLRLSQKPCDGYKTVGNCKVLCPKIGKICNGCRTFLGEKIVE